MIPIFQFTTAICILGWGCKTYWRVLLYNFREFKRFFHGVTRPSNICVFWESLTVPLRVKPHFWNTKITANLCELFNRQIEESWSQSKWNRWIPELTVRRFHIDGGSSALQTKSVTCPMNNHGKKTAYFLSSSLTHDLLHGVSTTKIQAPHSRRDHVTVFNMLRAGI